MSDEKKEYEVKSHNEPFFNKKELRFYLRVFVTFLLMLVIIYVLYLLTNEFGTKYQRFKF